jgi:hypothetical protein
MCRFKISKISDGENEPGPELGLWAVSRALEHGPYFLVDIEFSKECLYLILKERLQRAIKSKPS